MATSSWSGSNAARVVPIAASTRPQLGSLPNSAHLSRLLRAMLRPTSTASSSLGGAGDLDADLLGRALGVGDAAARRDRRTPARSASAKSSGSGRCRSAPLDSSTHGVVGRHAAVGVDAVEGLPRGRAQRLVGGDGVDLGVGGDHAQHRRQSRARACPAPLAMPPTVHPSPVTTACLATVSVVRIASAASAPPSVGQARRPRVDAGEQRGHRQPLADQAGRADRDLAGADAQRGGDRLGAAVGVGEAVRAGARVGAAGVEDDRAQPLVGDDLLGPEHRRRLDPVGREDGGGDVGRAVVDDQREVERPARLDAGGDAGRPESRCGGDAHGAIPSAVRPAVSGRPEHQVRVLHRLAGRALAQVVDRAGDDDPAGVEVDHGLQVRAVRAGRRGGVRLLPGGSTCTNGSSA